MGHLGSEMVITVQTMCKEGCLFWWTNREQERISISLVLKLFAIFLVCQNSYEP